MVSWCAKSSYEKSTIAVTTGIFEFNSDFHIVNSLMRPLVKFIPAAFQITSPIRMDDRVFQCSNTRANLVKNGGSLRLAALIQICQAVMHYSNLGAYIDQEQFLHYRELLRKVKLPCAGYFPIEPSKCAGLIGVRFAMFLDFIEDSDLRLMYQTMRNEETFEFLGEDKTPVARVNFLQGQLERFRRFIVRVGANRKDVNEFYEEHPDQLYKQPETIDEVVKLIERKAVNPAMADALDFGTGAKQHASSSYVLRDECLTVTRRGSEEFLTEKETLFNMIKSIEETKAIELKEDTEVIIFPENAFFHQIKSALDHARDLMLVTSLRFRNRYVSAAVPKKVSVSDIPLMKVVEHFWWGFPNMYGKTALNVAMKSYKAKLPWLSRDYERSLDQSPFKTHLGLANFVTSEVTQIKRREIIGPCKQRPTTTETIIDAIVNCQWPAQKMLHDNTAQRIVVNSNELDCVKTALWRSRIAVFATVTPISILTKLTLPITSYIQMSQLSREDVSLAIICNQLQGVRIGRAEVRLSKKGVFGAFVKRQSYDAVARHYTGEGVWRGSIDDVQLEINIDSDTAIVHTNRLERIPSIAIELHSLLRDLEVSSPYGYCELYFNLVRKTIQNHLPVGGPCVCIKRRENFRYVLPELEHLEITTVRNVLRLVSSYGWKFVTLVSYSIMRPGGTLGPIEIPKVPLEDVMCRIILADEPLEVGKAVVFMDHMGASGVSCFEKVLEYGSYITLGDRTMFIENINPKETVGNSSASAQEDLMEGVLFTDEELTGMLGGLFQGDEDMDVMEDFFDIIAVTDYDDLEEVQETPVVSLTKLFKKLIDWLKVAHTPDIFNFLFRKSNSHPVQSEILSSLTSLIGKHRPNQTYRFDATHARVDLMDF